MRSPLPHSPSKAERRHAKKRVSPKVNVCELHYSHPNNVYKERFECGRPVALLIQHLLDRKVSLSAPFLQLTAFETEGPDQKKGSILQCMENRRLFALKEYARISEKDVWVHVSVFSHNTIMEVHRFIHNCDNTDGRNVKLRKKKENRNNL